MSENSKPPAFGRLALGASSPDALIALEAREGVAELFAGVDALLGDVLVRALQGDIVLKVEHAKQWHLARGVSIVGLNSSHEETLENLFAVERQHSRGAWFLPEEVTLQPGLANLPSTFARYPRFATGVSWAERAAVVLRESPAGVFVWAVLEPLFERLFRPFALRGHELGLGTREWVLVAWAAVDRIVSGLGLNVEEELAVMRYGGGWGRMRAAEQLEAKRRLLASMAAQATAEMASRYRAYCLLRLIARYYSKTKDGRATRKQVLIRKFQPTLAGFFGGDWLCFLRYLGEEPHSDEEIVAAIPETKLFVGGRKSAAAVAAEKGVDVEEVERVLSTYWGSSRGEAAGTASPVEERRGVLHRLWQVFDEIHSRQARGMPSLRGLFDGGVRIEWAGGDPYDYNPRLYRKLLPADLLNEIERLWGAIMQPRWPDRIFSEISPQHLMAETFGSALTFWHGCALMAWFVCEGRYSSTDMAGLPAYYHDALAELERLGCPVDPSLFADLRESEARLGQPEPFQEEISSVEGPGSSRKSFGTGSRRSGFECLRDAITRHRREWTRRYLERYLRARWEGEAREAARLHAQAIAERGKPPTAKQFAGDAANVTNHWFGGDLSVFYGAIGERAPVRPVRVSLMPTDRLGFAMAVFQNLGGRLFERQTFVSSPEEGRAHAEEQDRHRKLAFLSEQSLRFIQLEEALGRFPDLKEAGELAFEYWAPVLSSDLGKAWETYVRAIDAAKRLARAAEDPHAGRKT